MIRAFVMVAVVAAAAPRIAHANECNLYTPQTFGAQLRVGCPVTVIALDSVRPSLPTFTRAGQPVATSIAHDQQMLEVTLYHYAAGTCDLAEAHADRTFDRYVITLSDLQPGEVIAVNGTDVTVQAAGACDPVQPFFACADPLQDCSMGSDSDTVTPYDPGCSASKSSPPLLGIALVGLVARRRRR